MSTMVNRSTSIVATIVCSVTWVVTIVALPFIEEYFYPSQPNSSWQRGLAITPFFIVPALATFYFTTQKSVQAGYTSFLTFICSCSFYGLLVLLACGLPSLTVLFFIGAFPAFTLLAISAYISMVVFLAQLPSLSIWWLIALRTHNNSFKIDAQKTRAF